MSGDAQPRKRKDKRKKKGDPVGQRTDHFLKEKSILLRKNEDSFEEDIFTPLKNSTDEVIHVHKDIVCGGNAVTKLIFFGLLATIGVMVGFILLEYRGSTDDETSSAVDSPWSVMFHDWIDQVADTGHDHGDESVIEAEHGSSGHEDHGHDPHEKDVETGNVNSWLLSWISFGQNSEESLESDLTEGEPTSEGILSWFQFSDKEENSVDVEESSSGGWFGFGAKEENSADVEESSSRGWFGFGGSIQDVEEDEPQEEEDHYLDAINDEEDNGDSAEKVVEDIEEEEEEEDDYESKEVDHVKDDEESNESAESDHEMDEDSEEEDESKSVIDDEEEEDDKDHDSSELVKEKMEEEEEEEDEDEEKEDDDEEQDSLELNQDKLEKDDEEQNSAELNHLKQEEEEEEEEENNDDDDEDNNSIELDYHKQENEEEEENNSIELDHYKEEVEEKNNSIELDDDKDEDELHDEKSDEDKEHKNENETPNEMNSLFKDGSWKDEDKDEKLEVKGETIDEEMFPEAIEALRKETEVETDELMEETLTENIVKETNQNTENEFPGDGEEETEGMALKFGVGVALVVVAHIVLVKKWNSWANGDEIGTTEEGLEISPEWQKPVTEMPVVKAVPVVTESTPTVSPPPPPAAPQPMLETKQTDEPLVEEESADEGSPIEEGSPAEDEEDEEDLEIDKQKFHDLLAKYGQETPESSDIEMSDDDAAQGAEYSEGEESPAGGEEVGSEDEAGSDDDLKEWTGIKKSDIEIETDSEVEEEEEEVEEESEEEPPPPPPPSKKRGGGGQKDLDEDYANAFITNDEDWAIREELDRADEEFNYETAQNMYRALLVKHPNSPRARYGLAQTFDRQADKERSNVMLDLAITGYKDTLKAPNITDILFIQVASRLINRLRFRGQHMNAVPVHNLLIEKYNTTPEYRTDLAITYLMVNRLEDARLVLKNLLNYWNHDPTALAHYGLVLKLQGNIHGCIKYFEEGIQTSFKPPSDPRLYFHFGDALARVGREADALKVYDSAVALGLFRSRYQRSLYNVDRLSARPWWTHQETTYASFFKILEDNWKRIRDEGANALKLKGMFKDEAEGLRDKGDWKQFELFTRGSKIKKNCETTPFTCSLIGSFEPAATCKRGQSKFSIMDADTHVWPHCGPTNCRLRSHLGLIVPPGPKIRVANITRTWEEGKVIIFDDSFEHEVWHNGKSLRLVLIVDIWHPELTRSEKLSLSPI